MRPHVFFDGILIATLSFLAELKDVCCSSRVLESIVGWCFHSYVKGHAKSLLLI